MKARELWGNAFNLSGLWSDRPVRLLWRKNLECYFDRSGNFASTGASERRSSYESFISESRAEVEAWTRGARAVGRSLVGKFPRNRRRK